VIDALLGAPGSATSASTSRHDERWRDADSIALLESVIETLAAKGLKWSTSTARW